MSDRPPDTNTSPPEAGLSPDTDPPPEADRSPGLRETVAMIRFGLRGMYATKLPQMAAALAFRTLFALIPMLVISVAVIGAFADPDQVRSTLDKALESSGVSEIVISEPPPEETPEEADAADSDASQAVPTDEPRAEPAADEQPDLLPDLLPDQLPEQPTDGESESFLDTDTIDDNGEVRLEAFLNDLVTRLLQIPFGAIGAAGLLTLIYAAISMLTEIEKAFNQVYRAKTLRSWGRRITQYWSVLTLGALLIFTAFYTSEQFRGFDTDGLGSFVGAGLATGVSVGITTLLLMLGYQTIPNTRVHVRSSLVGALVAAILWEIAKWAFRQYIEFSVSYAKLYGSIGVLPLFMLWTYATWLIVLFGLQVSYGLQHLSLAREMMNQQDDDEALTDPASSVAIVAAIGERFEKGKATSADRLADRLGLPASAVAAMLEKLSDVGVLHRVDGGDERFALAVPADRVLVRDVLAAAQSLAAGRLDHGPAAGAMRRLRAAEREAVGETTLAQLLDNNPSHERPAADQSTEGPA
ncbi:MAG: YhjD/YihY/BrkB family envelope integrity protein [Planctomycetota bacterium]